MATISFLAGENFALQDLGGSGLGFYGPGTFGAAIKVGEYQDNTYITDSTGATQGPKVDNVKWAHANSGELAGNDVRNLLGIPNYLATLNMRFTHSTAVKTQNAQLRIFDRVSTDRPASGVTCRVAELVHPWTNASPNGSGSTSWKMPGGSGGLISGRTYDLPMTFAASPGTSGLSPSGANTTDTQHDWYAAITVSPDSYGSKTDFGLYFSLEYYN